MTKDLSDVVSDLKQAEAKINNDTKSAKKEAAPKLVQAELPDVFKTSTGELIVATHSGQMVNMTKAVNKENKTTKNENKPKENKPKETMTREDKIIELLTHFCQECGHMTYTKSGQQNAGRYPKPEAWKYLADIAGYYTRVESTKYCGWQNNPCAFRVEATCSLVRKADDVVETTVTMCAASDEDFVKNKNVESAYGLAITRAETRAVRSRLGHYMSCVGLEITPYEEIGDKFMNLEEI